MFCVLDFNGGTDEEMKRNPYELNDEGKAKKEEAVDELPNIQKGGERRWAGGRHL